MTSAEPITVNLSGLSGKLDVVQAPTDATIAELKRRVASKIGGESAMYLRLTYGDKVLTVDTELLADVIGPGTSAVELTVIRLEGPEYFDQAHLTQFMAAVESATDLEDVVSKKLSFSLASLQVLDLSSKAGWLEGLLCAEYPGSDCVAAEFQFSAFLGALRDMQSLTKLNLSGNFLSSQGIDPHEDFVHEDLPDREHPCIALGLALPRTLEVLTVCYTNWWNCEEVEFIATGMAKGAPLSDLRELCFVKALGGYSQESDSVTLVRGVATCLSCMPVLEKLCLESCNLRHERLPQLAKSLPKTIRSLNLLRNFCVDDQEGADVSVKALVAELCKLEELHLSVAKAGEDAAACQSIKSSVPMGCTVRFVAAYAPLTSPAALPCIRGLWASEKGQINILNDKLCGRLSYVEFIGDGSEFLHGWLEPVGGGGPSAWRAELMIRKKDEKPWYGPIFGEKPETVGDVMITLRSAADGPRQLEMQTKAEEDAEWTAPVAFNPVVD